MRIIFFAAAIFYPPKNSIHSAVRIILCQILSRKPAYFRLHLTADKLLMIHVVCDFSAARFHAFLLSAGHAPRKLPGGACNLTVHRVFSPSRKWALE